MSAHHAWAINLNKGLRVGSKRPYTKPRERFAFGIQSFLPNAGEDRNSKKKNFLVVFNAFSRV